MSLHLYLPNYPPEKLDAEMSRIAEQGLQLGVQKASLDRQLAELRQAIVDEKGLRRFCEIATRSLDAFDDAQWRMLLETIRLTILIGDGGDITVKMAVPTVKEEKSVIAVGSSRNTDRSMPHCRELRNGPPTSIVPIASLLMPWTLPMTLDPGLLAPTIFMMTLF